MSGDGASGPRSVLTAQTHPALVPILGLLGFVTATISSLGAQLIPSISRADRIPLSEAQWALTVTLVAGAVSTPTMGKLGDGPYRRQLMLAGLGFSFLGCVIAALPGPFIVLVVGRALQGLGLGTLPLAMAVARDNLPPDKSVAAIAMLSVSSAAGVGIGYPLTGIVSTHFGFHMAFWLGALIIGTTLAMVALVVPNSAERKNRHLDVAGAVTISGALVVLLLALSEGADWGWASGRLILMLGGFAVLSAVWIVEELRSEDPLVNLRLLGHRVVLIANISAFVIGISMYLLLSLVTDYVQAPRSTGYGFGASVFVASLVLVPVSLTSVPASRGGRELALRFGPRRVLPPGAVLIASAAAMFAATGTGLWQAFAALALTGVGLGGTFAVMPMLIVSAIPTEQTSSALGMYQVLRYVGFALGSGVAATVLRASSHDGVPTQSGYHAGLVIAAGCSLLAAAVCAVLGGRPKSEAPVVIVDPIGSVEPA